MGFIVSPTKWELAHYRGIFAGQEYAAEHNGELPDTPMWRMLERRYEINPGRFAFYHRNLVIMLERNDIAHCDPDPRPPFWPIDRDSPFPPPGCTNPPPPSSGGGANQVVPEPPAVVMLGMCLILGLAIRIAATFLARRIDRPISDVEMAEMRAFVRDRQSRRLDS